MMPNVLLPRALRHSGRHVLAIGVAVTILLGFHSSERGCRADDKSLSDELDDDEPFDFDDGIVDGDTRQGDGESKSRRRRSGRLHARPNDDGSGLDGRLGHIGFKTLGRNESITHVELFPYIIDDDRMLFGDVRMFVTNQGRLGTNLGLGHRILVPEWDRVIGASIWYDADDSVQHLFHQFGLSLETYGDPWEFRTNLYLPFGDTQHDRSVWAENLRFTDNRLMFDRSRAFSSAMYGGDLEAGLLLPSRFARDHDLRVFAGAYFFAGKDVDDIAGVSARVSGNLTDSITTQLIYTNDGTFGSNLALGVAIQFPGRARQPTRGTPLRRFVRRNYNIVVDEESDTVAGLVAVDPQTGNPYVFQHVSSNAMPGGNGTVNAPFLTIADAQAAGADVVFVHSGSILNDPVVLQSGTRVLGEGGQHVVAIQEFGNVFLPSATGGTARPYVKGVTGNAVTLAANSEFSGFIVDTPTGHGITGVNGIDGAVVRQVDIYTPGQDGIFLHNSTGDVLFEDVYARNATATGFHVNGGSPNVVFTGGVQNTAAASVLIENTTGGTVDLRGATVTDVGGTGLAFTDNDGAVVVGDVTTQNTTGPGISVSGGQGNTYFNGTTQITATNDVGISVQNTNGLTRFANVDVTGDNRTALFARNAANLFVDAGTLRGINGGAAADIENSTIGVNLTSVFANGGAFGVRVVASSGAFTVAGTGDFGTGGLIQNTTNGFVLDNAPFVSLQNIDFTTNGVAVLASNSNTLVLWQNRITNSTGIGIDATNLQNVQVVNSTFSGNGGQDVRLQYNLVGNYVATLTGNTLTNASTSAIDIRTLAGAEGSTLNLTTQANTITTTAAGANGLFANWNGLLVGSISNNAFTSTGGTSDGIDLTTSSLTDTPQISIVQNSFEMTGGTDTGIRLTTLGPSQIAVSGNAVNFNSANGVGMNFTLAESAVVSILSNTVTDNVSSGTGILFTSVDGPSTFSIDNNLIQLLSADANIDRGIVFTTVVDTITLQGTLNNVVTGATTPFSIPTGTSTGWIFVNSALVP